MANDLSTDLTANGPPEPVPNLQGFLDDLSKVGHTSHLLRPCESHLEQCETDLFSCIVLGKG